MKNYILSFLIIVNVGVYAQPGSLDNTFGVGGKVSTSFGSSIFSAANSVLIQNDGKIVVAGTSYYDFAIARYNSIGILDSTFSIDGLVIEDIEGNDWGYSVAIQSDGKIVMCGSSKANFALLRVNTNGILDTSFNHTGKIICYNFGASNDYAQSIALQNDGKIVVGGHCYGFYNGFAVVRYNPNGTIDTTFGSGGIVSTSFGSGNFVGVSIAIQSDGKIVMGGFCKNPVDNDFALVRYNYNGSLDNTFGVGGIVTSDILNDDYGSAVAIQNDGKILLIGYSNNGSNKDISLARYNTDGSFDSSFGSGGKVITDINGSDNYAYATAIQSNGKIIVGGYSGLYPNNDFAVIRYNSNGSLDNTFGSSGSVLTDFGTYDYGQSVAIQGDGKIVMAGYSNDKFALARYNGDIPAVAIGENSAKMDLYAFPNPTSGIFTICSEKKTLNAQIYLFDVFGTCLQKGNYEGQSYTFELSGYSEGIYFVEVVVNGVKSRHKIVLQ